MSEAAHQPPPPAPSKQALRDALRAHRAHPSPSARQQADAAAAALIPLLQSCRTVALHAPSHGELDAITPLLSNLVGPRWCFPALDGGSMAFFAHHELPSLIGAFGLREPPRTHPVPLDQLDALLIPGLAFTEAGDRLGRGGGFYDKVLAHVSFPTLRIGLCYQWQIVTTLPVEAHDVAMTHLATELGIRLCQTIPPLHRVTP